MRWFYGALAAIALAVTGSFVSSAVRASHDVDAADCDPSGEGPADGPPISALLPRAHPCHDLKNELVLARTKRQIESVAAGVVTVGLLVVAITRRRKGDSPLPPDRGLI